MNRNHITDLTCRVCLNIEELMVNIYEEVEDFQSNLVELLEACGGLMVDRSDDLPKYLCKVCAEELLVAAKFREKCAKSKELFGQMLPKEEHTETPRLVYISHTNEIDPNPFASMSEEILNEIIIEEVEEKMQMMVEWNEDAVVENENENLYIEGEAQDSLIKCDSDVQDRQFKETDSVEVPITSEYQVQTNGLQTEEGFIVSDHGESGYFIETITKQKQKAKTTRKMQEAAPLKFDCDECGAAFSNHDNLSRHLRIHPDFLGKLHTCSFCSHSFTMWDSLQTHYQTTHPNDAPQADVGTKKRRPRNKTCDTCGKVCNSAASLKVHTRTHTGDRPYPCTECSKAFKTQAALQLHLKRHAGQFDWECEVCGKAFIESSNLRVHMRTHTGERPHLCKVCGKKFSRVFVLQLHLRTHTGEKPYKCETCNKAYRQKCDLDIHVRSHTGVRPYVCPICFRGFVKSYALQKHVRQHPQESVAIDVR